MQVNVKLYASFRTGRFDTEIREYGAGVKVQDVVGDLGLSQGEVGTILINAKYGKFHTPLRDGDSLALFPVISGG